MRIISKHHDYYDCMMKQLCDRSITFVRNQSDVESPFQKELGRLVPYESRDYTKKHDSETFYMRPGLIFLCGEIYPFINIGDKFIYKVSELPEKLKEEAVFYASNWLIDHQVKFPGYFLGVAFKIKLEVLKDYSFKNGIAYFALSRPYYNVEDLIIYPTLKNFGFHRVMPAIDVFQKIQMYLTNDLAKEKMMPENPISDKLKAESHGFNKWSFRKEPSNKKG